MEPESADDFNDYGNPAAAPERPLPRVAGSRTALRGAIKSEPADFEVEEIPAYHPNGTGEHLFLWIEKENVAAEQLTRHVARTLEVPVGDVGVAGLKDKRAITRQYLSVPARVGDRIDRLETPQIRVLSAKQHQNKLRTGHLQGNRFSILVRGAEATALAEAEASAEQIRKSGFPNYFGEQRYGVDRETLELGRHLLSGTKSPRDIPHSRRKFLLRFALSAAQSALFDQALAARIDDGLFSRVLVGDVMQVVASGGVFVVEDADVEQVRFDVGELSITGPMYGPKMRAPIGVPAEREAAILESNGIAPDAFMRYSNLTSGTRRPYAVRPADLDVSAEAEGLRFRFTLPPGTYATTLLREFLRDEGEQ
ncbi:MAG: tRNA pseudouridine(13) synthase TruD [Planctomycetaceae bacterium]